MEPWIMEIIGAVAPGIVVGIVLAAWNKRDKKRTDHAAQKEQNRLEIEVRRVDLELATSQLVREVAEAIKRGTTNGEMNAALVQHQEALDKFRKVERIQMAKGGME